MSRATLLTGDALAILDTLPGESVQCCVTSPPYWGLRDYGVPGQLGLERAPEEYVEKLVAIFREVRRVLRKDGTLFLNLGDSYWGGGRGAGGSFDADRRGWRALPCDTFGTEPLGSQVHDSTLIRLCDACQAALPGGSARTDSPPAPEPTDDSLGPSLEHRESERGHPPMFRFAHRTRTPQSSVATADQRRSASLSPA